MESLIVKDFWTDLLNTAIIGPTSTLLQSVSLLGAHFLAGLSQETNIIGALGDLVGKRETKDFWSGLLDVTVGSLVDAGNALLGTVTLSLAQLLAQFSMTGLPSVGKRGIFDDLLDSVTTSLTTAANSLLSDLALQLAISLATFATGKRELKEFWTDLGDVLLGSLVDAGNALLGTVTLSLAQLLAQFSMTGLPSVGKRGIFDDLLDSVTTSLTAAANSLLSDLALQLAISLATFAGKREEKGFLDDLTAAFGQIVDGVLMPAIMTQAQNLAILGAHLLVGLSQETDVLGALSNLVGKRGIFDDLLDSLTASLTSAANSLLSDVALQLAISLATFATGK